MKAIDRRLEQDTDSAELFAPFFADQTTEQLLVAMLDEDKKLISLERRASPFADSIGVSLRQIGGRALMHDARAIVLAHNHPSGDPSPSAVDIQATDEIVSALRPFDIRVLDHLIFAGSDWISFRRLNLI